MHLLEREKEELLKPEKRFVECPDGETRQICMSVLHWRWYDRLRNSAFGDCATDVLDNAVELSVREQNIKINWTLDAILEWAVDNEIRMTDGLGMDLTETDDDLKLMMARKQVTKFHERNPKSATKKS